MAYASSSPCLKIYQQSSTSMTYDQLCECVIGEEDEEFANLEKDEINAKKRGSVMFVDK